MNENINIAPQESKLVIYLVVAAKVIVYILLMLGFAGVLGAVCIKAVSFFKIDGILKEVVMQSSFLAGTFLAAWVLLKNWDHLPITDLGLSLKGRAKDIFWGEQADRAACHARHGGNGLFHTGAASRAAHARYGILFHR